MGLDTGEGVACVASVNMVLSIGNDGNFEAFLTSGTSQTTKPCCYIITLQYALLQGYMRENTLPLYIIMNC